MTENKIDVVSIVAEVKKSGGVVIRSFRTKDELVAVIQSALNEGKLCAFWPSKAALRYFFNTAGFIAVMGKIQLNLNNYSIRIEPNIYGSQYLCVIGPAVT